ncbi:unnamed protein product [Coregonus sp. 'balchen']|nr:unnamed protein product [Coregonus sp. 'balchen']
MTCRDTLRSPPLSHKMDIWRKGTLLLFLIGMLVKPGLSTMILDQPPRTVESLCEMFRNVMMMSLTTVASVAALLLLLNGILGQPGRKYHLYYIDDRLEAVGSSGSSECHTCHTSSENAIYMNMHLPRSAIKQPSPRPGIQMDNQKIPPPLKHTRTPATAHDSKHLRTPTPARANDNKHLFRTPNPPRAHDGKHLTIPTPATAHDNKHFRTPTPARAHESKYSPKP